MSVSTEQRLRAQLAKVKPSQGVLAVLCLVFFAGAGLSCEQSRPVDSGQNRVDEAKDNSAGEANTDSIGGPGAGGLNGTGATPSGRDQTTDELASLIEGSGVGADVSDAESPGDSDDPPGPTCEPVPPSSAAFDVAVGWSGIGAGRINDQALILGLEGEQLEEGQDGVRRLPLQGLVNIVQERGSGRAVVMIPTPARDLPDCSEFDVLMHFHGYGERRYDDLGGGRTRDITNYAGADQLLESGRQMILVFPVGVITHDRHDAQWGPERYSEPRLLAAEVVEVLTALGEVPPGARVGHVTVSGSSGGGIEITRMMRVELRARDRHDDDDDDDDDAEDPTLFDHAILIDGIHDNDLSYVETWLDVRIAEDLAAIAAVETPEEQQTYLEEQGTRMVAMASRNRSNVQYGRRYSSLGRTLDGRFEALLEEGLDAGVLDTLSANFPVMHVGHSVEEGGFGNSVRHTEMLRHGHLAWAIGHLP